MSTVPGFVIPSDSQGVMRVSDICDAVNLLEPETRRKVAAVLEEVNPDYGWTLKPDDVLRTVY